MKELLADKQRQQLCEMMYHAFVEARLLGWDGKSQQISDLAGAFHNLPREIYDPEGFNWSLFKGDLQGYQDLYHQQPYRGKFNYLIMLETITSDV
jgi:hypothetical protein